MPHSKLEQILLHSKLINPADLAEAATGAVQKGKRLAWTILDSGAIDERSFAQLLSKGTSVELMDPLPGDVPPWIYRKLPAPVAREYKTVPIDLDDSRLKVALIDPTDQDLIDVLAAATGLKVVPVVAVRSSLERLLEHVYPFDVDVDATKLSARNVDNEPGLDTARISLETREVGMNPVVPETPAGLAQQLEQLEKRLGELASELGEARVTLAKLRRSLSGK